VHGDVEHQAVGGVLFDGLAEAVEDLPGQHEVPGGADRQELGDALHHCEHDDR
jgi:hypothetical protein